MKSLFLVILALCAIQNALSYSQSSWKCLNCNISNNKQCEDEFDQGHEGTCFSETNRGCLSVTQSK